jgi:hypothetical protein
MRVLLVAILTMMISFSLEAKKSVSLNEAVKQAEDQGRVISARTVNDKHEVKVLTPSGSVKTININAGDKSQDAKPPRPEYYNRGGKSMRDRNQNPVIPQRFRDNKRQQRTIKLNTRQLDLQPATRQRGGSKTDGKKDK